jgi:plastocyanin
MHNVWRSIPVLAVALAACGGGGGGTPPPVQSVFTTLTVSATTLNMVDGDVADLVATPRDQNGAAMTGLPLATFTLTSGTAASVSTQGRVTAIQQGSSTVTASLTSGGVTKTATTTVNVSALPTSRTVTASATGTTFDPDTVKIATGGTVMWSFPGMAHNVIWDGAAPPLGNIGTRGNGETESRTFPNAGTYAYHCSIHGASMNGRVIARTP